MPRVSLPCSRNIARTPHAWEYTVCAWYLALSTRNVYVCLEVCDHRAFLVSRIGTDTGCAGRRCEEKHYKNTNVSHTLCSILKYITSRRRSVTGLSVSGTWKKNKIKRFGYIITTQPRNTTRRGKWHKTYSYVLLWISNQKSHPNKQQRNAREIFWYLVSAYRVQTR